MKGSIVSVSLATNLQVGAGAKISPPDFSTFW